jgi:hypothetical protein
MGCGLSGDAKKRRDRSYIVIDRFGRAGLYYEH